MRDNLPVMLRDAAKKWREKHKVVGVGETRYDFALEEAADAIEELTKRVDESIPKDDAEIIIAEVSKPRWIPVTERLPKEEETVLAFGTLGEAWINWRHDNKWGCYSGVTHWMPLPQPPKED